MPELTKMKGGQPFKGFLILMGVAGFILAGCSSFCMSSKKLQSALGKQNEVILNLEKQRSEKEHKNAVSKNELTKRSEHDLLTALKALKFSNKEIEKSLGGDK